MGQDQRDAVSLPCPFVYEVNVDGAEFSAKVLERVELALLRPPVEAVGPVAKKSLQVLEVGPLRPGGARRLIRPARVTDARSQVDQNLIRNADRKRRHMHRLALHAHESGCASFLTIFR